MRKFEKDLYCLSKGIKNDDPTDNYLTETKLYKLFMEYADYLSDDKPIVADPEAIISGEY